VTDHGALVVVRVAVVDEDVAGNLDAPGSKHCPESASNMFT